MIANRLLVLTVSQTPLPPRALAAVVGVALLYQLPVRVLVEGAASLPTEAFLLCPDVQVVSIPAGAGRRAFHQVRAWLEEVSDGLE